MKTNQLSILLTTITLVVLSLSVFAQGNQPSGNLIYGPDGVIYGAYTKTTASGNRPSTIYKYVPGSATIDPVLRLDDHVAEVHVVDPDGFIYGTAIQYNASGDAIYSRVFRVKNDGTAYTILYNHDVATSGIHHSLVLVGDRIYGIRTGGGKWGHGCLFYVNKSGGDYWPITEFRSADEQPTSMIPHYAWSDDVVYYGKTGDLIGFWFARTSGGLYGKGSVVGTGFYGEPVVPRVDFLGYENGNYLNDGEGELSIVNDNHFMEWPTAYAVTQRGGWNNEGTIFQITQDMPYKSWNFKAPYVRPFGKPFVDGEGNLFGLGGDFANNTGFIYQYRPYDGSTFMAIPFSASSAVNQVTSIVVPNNNVIYGTSRTTGSDSENGSLFSIHKDGSNTQVIFKFNDGYSRLVNPASDQADASVTPSLGAYVLDGVTNYTIEVSESSDFTCTVHVVNSTGGLGKVNSPGLKYSTRYYARVKTNLIDDYGTVTTFTTHAPEKYSFVSSPVNGATNVSLNGTKVTANIVYGATFYTIELNTSSDFTGTSIVKSSAVVNQRTITFDGLQPSTTYYSRTKTNLPSNWGPTRSFTTIALTNPPPMIAETHELNVYPNPFGHTFTIEGDESGEHNITLIDLTGRELIKTQVTQEPKTVGDNLAPGIYLLRITTNGRTTVKRMVKR
jgi:hypothetical protein